MSLSAQGDVQPLVYSWHWALVHTHPTPAPSDSRSLLCTLLTQHLLHRGQRGQAEVLEQQAGAVTWCYTRRGGSTATMPSPSFTTYRTVT